MKAFLPIIIYTASLFSCQPVTNSFHYETEEEWKLAYRIYESELLQKYELGASQLDSLLSVYNEIEPRILNSGLKCLAQLNQNDKLFDILTKSSVENKRKICNEEWFNQLPNQEKKKAICNSFNQSKEEFTHPQIREQLLIMYINDQYVRGSSVDDLHESTGLEIEKNLYDEGDPISTDIANQKKLKQIFDEVGFPSKTMVGELGMISVFLIIQHSDLDKEFQNSQLKNVEEAVRKGDIKGPHYAYLFDRIMINSGKKQLYGTQFSYEDLSNGEVTLAPVEDIKNLNKRRREIGMMPIENYKKLFLSRENEPSNDSDKIKINKMKSVQNGMSAPNGSLVDLNNGLVSLDDFRGKLLVIDFWASWCSPCLKETPIFMQSANKYSNENVNFITVSIDESATSWKEFVNENNWIGNNYWLGKKEENPLFSFMYSEVEVDSSKLVLVGIPKYVFISAEGKILNNNAPHPNSKKFEEELNKYLKY